MGAEEVLLDWLAPALATSFVWLFALVPLAFDLEGIRV